MKNKVFALAAVAALTSSVAFAQTATTAPAETAPAAVGADAALSGPGFTMGTKASGPLKFVNVQKTDLTASQLDGMDIYNAKGEDIGEIEDVVIGEGKAVIGLVASVGGFLGIDKSYVVLDPASVAINNDNGTWKAYVDTTKDALQNAPKLDYDKLDD
ncbi:MULTISPECIES: PRC-barrel domain-containing protein [Rhizobium/Agrobacterium group]|uniref:PRC-barrel domain-containing protein n=1 Tax=Rhizobium/Agrobacterium group TaxID=227290 RepID=UPI00110EEEE4|nr:MULTISPECIES: PRC-barrel domain-containing protein [Rhizobium/Agrobacterium group]NWJ26581.1 PRC-barrel domain-containing protein [Rhizobium sp. RM]TMV22468.1 PRC-barrel domain containing protein [Rhizobium sp. Td3]UXS01940.1 PRC-barrel domain containing protein [Agrobacterium tumefaciens]